MEEITLKEWSAYKGLIPIEGEIFKDYPQNENYQISNFGRVKSKEKIVNHNYGGKAIKKERVLTQTLNQYGYFSVGLTKDGKVNTQLVSRLVAITFISNPENKLHVNHINGIKTDNRVENLEWNTPKENITHAWKTGLSRKQRSYTEMKERLNKINPYLMNDLWVQTPIGNGRIIIDQNCYRIEYENGQLENFIKAVRIYGDDFKIIIRDLSDLTKEIEHNGEKFVPIDYNAFKTDRESIIEFQNKFAHFKSIKFGIIERLIEWKFNVFQIADELIVRVTEDFNPYK